VFIDLFSTMQTYKLKRQFQFQKSMAIALAMKIKPIQIKFTIAIDTKVHFFRKIARV
jgi:hypothetical protein